MIKKIFFTLILTIIFTSQTAQAFPENVRHGYVNCTTCHITSSGGGVLTAYGRGLSKEIMSTWGTENETRPFYFVDAPKWLHLGGDLRLLQMHKDTPKYKEGRFILMQADFEAGATVDKFQFVGSIGRSDLSGPSTISDFLVSHKHFVVYNPNDEFSIRAGRFFPAFGLGTPDHTISTRRGLRWDQGAETYNIEASYIGEKYDAFVTAIFGRPDKPSYDREKGFSLRGSTNFKEAYKIGAGYYFGKNDSFIHHIVGPYAILGFTPQFFLLAEIDIQNTIPVNRTSKWGAVHYARLDYEIYQGVHVFLSHDYSKSDFKDPLTMNYSYGVGVQFFPRPHFEITAQYQKQKISRVDPSNYADLAWILMHFYP